MATGERQTQANVAWPTAGYDLRNTRHSPDALTPTGNPTTAWTRTSANNDTFTHSSPVVADGIVYIGSTTSRGGQLYAVDANSGEQTWSTGQLFFRSVETTPAVAEGRLYYIHTDGKVVAADPATGTEQWTYEVEGKARASPAVDDGTIYFGTNAGTMYAVDAANGTIQWAYDTHEDNERLKLRTTPAVHDGTVYATTSGLDTLYVYAFDAATGDLDWKQDLVDVGNAQYYLTAPTVANSLLYLGDYESEVLWALDPTTGEEVWKTEGVDLGPDAGPAVAGCTLFVGTRDGKLRAFDAATGDEQWSTILGSKVVAAPAVANGVVYVGDTGGQFHAIDAADGGRLWAENLESKVTTSPAISNGLVYVANQETLYAFDGDVTDRRGSVDYGSCPDGEGPNSRITGEVTYEDGTPAEGVAVDIVDIDTDTAVATLQTNTQGAFGPVQLSPANLTADVDLSGYETFATQVQLEEDEAHTIQVTLDEDTGTATPNSRVRGRVRYQDGTPAEGVAVDIVDIDTDTVVATLQTNTQGRFGPVQLSPANLTADVDLSGYETFATQVQLEEDEAHTIQVTLDENAATATANDGETETADTSGANSGSGEDGSTASPSANGPGFGVVSGLASLAALVGANRAYDHLRDDDK
ncbi:outer membrane protein assembly factor BamB family protein [Salinibaculum marinum]|uniref:outer membrane protein assembly factor BamB family protein n=1 Tax=Salinibaculum sp. GCM10025337 TaxID=3252686 RepID=UPI0036D35B4B